MPDLAPADLAQPVAIVCHDAGAANLVIAWVRADLRGDVRAYMVGPALNLWQSAFPEGPIAGSAEAAMDGAATVLTGTGWATSIEHEARVKARERGLFSVAVIDHWTNYAARFERDGIICLPDALVVSDPWAKALAEKTFAALTISQWPNRYLDDQISDIAPVPVDGDTLYICEPARNDWGRNSPGEFQAIIFFLQNRALLGIGRECAIRLRPHPSEPAGKYDAILANHGYLALDDSGSLASSISKAKLVVGMNSAAMIVALAAGRRVASTLPGWAPQCALPHDGIIHLRDMVAA
jgi:hypothetical protein